MVKAHVKAPKRKNLVRVVPGGRVGWRHVPVKRWTPSLEAIAEEMRRDDTIFLLGEDVAEAGTPFKILSGLVEEFGTDRIVDTPIAEPGFMGHSCRCCDDGQQANRRFDVWRFSIFNHGSIMQPSGKNPLYVGGQAQCTIGATHQFGRHPSVCCAA